MNNFDYFIKNKLQLKYYGRYVDDFIIVHADKEYLKSLIAKINSFLKIDLHLTLHPKMIYMQHYSKGVKFLGAIIKPNRIYIANRTKGSFMNPIEKQNNSVRLNKPSKNELAFFLSSMNSYLGMMVHYQTYNLRKKVVESTLSVYWLNHFYISGGYAKICF
jgi:RNA-directed DNA polymerase